MQYFSQKKTAYLVGISFHFWSFAFLFSSESKQGGIEKFTGIKTGFFLVYVENGRSTTATTFTFTTASTTGISWKAKVTQIECSRWFTSVLVCFTLLLNQVIHRDKKKLIKLTNYFD